MPTIEEFLDDAKRRMDRSIETTRTEFNSVRTGRASAALLDRITIDYYGTPTQLKNMATIGAPEPRLLTVQPLRSVPDQGDREGGAKSTSASRPPTTAS